MKQQEKPTAAQLREWKQRNAELNALLDLIQGCNPTPEALAAYERRWQHYCERYRPAPGAATV